MGGVFWRHQSKLSRSDILRKYRKTGHRWKSFYNEHYMLLRPCGLVGDNNAPFNFPVYHPPPPGNPGLSLKNVSPPSGLPSKMA